MFHQADHIGIFISDIERSMRFYGETLGLPLVGRYRHGDAELIFYQLGEVMIELIARDGPTGGDGIVNHIAFRVDGADRALAHLRTHGVTLEHEEPFTVFDGHRIAFFRGPDGERFELFERAKA